MCVATLGAIGAAASEAVHCSMASRHPGRKLSRHGRAKQRGHRQRQCDARDCGGTAAGRQPEPAECRSTRRDHDRPGRQQCRCQQWIGRRCRGVAAREGPVGRRDYPPEVDGRSLRLSRQRGERHGGGATRYGHCGERPDRRGAGRVRGLGRQRQVHELDRRD